MSDSKVVDISELSRSFKEKATRQELSLYAESQHRTIQDLMKKNEALSAEVEHLKNLLLSTNKDLQVGSSLKLDPLNEDFICDLEIKKLKEISLVRVLTLEEAKRFDIYVKTKYLIKKGEPPIDVPKSKTKSSLQDLIEAAKDGGHDRADE